MSSLGGNNNQSARRYWRSREQFADTPEFRNIVEREFPHMAGEMDNRWSRRSFLRLMGASLAMAGLAGCRRPVEKIVPYVKRPETVVPGVAERYATTMSFGDEAFGVLALSREGRPVKLEGNELHPATLGASSIFIEAEILNLYDPDRLQRVRHGNVEKKWGDFEAFLKERSADFEKNRGDGLAVLSGAFVSPSMSIVRKVLLDKFPRARWVTFDSVSNENIYRGTETAFGRAMRPWLRLEKAEVVVALDADFLGLEAGSVANAKGYARARRVDSKKDAMNRLYAAEGPLSLTGSLADHRLRVATGDIAALTTALGQALAQRGVDAGLPGSAAGATPDRKWLETAAADLAAARGRSVVVAGRRQPPVVHAMVAAINQALGNIGRTVDYFEAPDGAVSNREALRSLADDMRSGKITTLVMLGGNPVYDAPVDYNFAEALAKVPNSVHLSLQSNETSAKCGWQLPQSHFLESWGDAQTFDGTRSVVQPLIAPLFDSRSSLELVALMARGKHAPGYDLVRERWQHDFPASRFEQEWKKILHDGVRSAKLGPPRAGEVRKGRVASLVASSDIAATSRSIGSMEISFAPSQLYDGRYANNGWLQELPDPISKLAWDNAALMSKKTADELGVKNGEEVALECAGRSVAMPVWIVPGYADYVVQTVLGYGRDFDGRVARGAGFDAGRLRGRENFDFGTGLKASPTGQSHILANTQDHSSMEGRPIARENTLTAYRKTGVLLPEGTKHPPLIPLWEPHKYDEGYQWGMTIDLNACIGCGACTVACQSENNIPVVGKLQVYNGREMHWIRVDRYFASPDGDDENAAFENPEVVHQPVACHHCENAPCESVCPVNATVHDKEGLNVMVYNRCIGTRYCSNNCPYKVRRFNFFNYTHDYPEIVKMAQNPQVTVRSRGVMEKCTFCLQRIVAGKTGAKLEERRVRDGEIITACQQACPADAIVFGDINDPDSRVSKIKQNDRNYVLLEELNTKPRTTYLGKLRNPHPDLDVKKQPMAGHGDTAGAGGTGEH